MLGKVVAENQRDWDDWLPLVMAAYRASPHSTTKCSPNLLIFGRETAMPVDVVLGRPQEDRSEERTGEEFVSDLASRLESAFRLAREGLQTAAERRKKAYDLRVREKSFKKGDWVWYYYPRRYQRRSPKWQRMYTGPFLITKCIEPSNYVIQRSKASQPKVVHGDKLKLWGGAPLPSWLEPEVGRETAVEPSQGAESEAVGEETIEGARGDLAIDNPEVGVSVAPKVRPVRERKSPRRLVDYDL